MPQSSIERFLSILSFSNVSHISCGSTLSFFDLYSVQFLTMQIKQEQNPHIKYVTISQVYMKLPDFTSKLFSMVPVEMGGWAALPQQIRPMVLHLSTCPARNQAKWIVKPTALKTFTMLTTRRGLLKQAARRPAKSDKNSMHYRTKPQKNHKMN